MHQFSGEVLICHRALEKQYFDCCDTIVVHGAIFEVSFVLNISYKQWQSQPDNLACYIQIFPTEQIPSHGNDDFPKE